ncbi:MAG: hypothetical protein Q7S22_06975 [Candidatus Micrarchaeota archaeon]|nr:hypothetical protein [Candidatus Micrarchaeota archaeon]
MSLKAARKHLAQRARREARELGIKGQERTEFVREVVARIPISEPIRRVRDSGDAHYYSSQGTTRFSQTRLGPIATYSISSSALPRRPKIQMSLETALKIAIVAFEKRHDFEVHDAYHSGSSTDYNAVKWSKEFTGVSCMTYGVLNDSGFTDIHVKTRYKRREVSAKLASPSLKVAHHLVKEAREKFNRNVDAQNSFEPYGAISLSAFVGISIGTSVAFIAGGSFDVSFGISILAGIAIGAIITGVGSILLLKDYKKLKTEALNELARELQTLGQE